MFNNHESNITNRYIMAVNQSQVDHIITAASEDDPEVKLQNLEREVDLIKTSIKRLLMDIRERMNELENPFTLVAPGTAGLRQGLQQQRQRQQRHKVLHWKHGKQRLKHANPDLKQQKEKWKPTIKKNGDG